MFINTLILSISSSIDAMGIGITYGLKKMNTRTDGKVYLYLPADAEINSITLGDNSYYPTEPIAAGSTGTMTLGGN